MDNSKKLTGNLPLAVEIGDVAATSAESSEPLDAETEAKRLMHEHPEAEVSAAEVAGILEEEAEAAGAVPPSETLKISGDPDGGWWIGSLGPADGPYVDEQSAVDAAIDRAKTLAEAGHPTAVVVQRGNAAPAEVWPPM